MNDRYAAKLHWQCRRGMRELDLLLKSFLENGYATLSAAECEQFEQLLKYPDDILLSWLFQRSQPTDDHFIDLIIKIRQSVNH